MDAIILVSNLLLLLLWARAWNDADREFYFNPLLSAPVRLTDRVFDFLRPVFAGLSSRVVAALLLLLILALRGALAHRLSTGGWTLTLGTSVGRRIAADSWSDCLLFSAAEFGVFLVRLWGLALLVSLVTPTPRPDRATQAFRFFTPPFSLLPRLPLAACVVLLNILAVLLLPRLGRPLDGQVQQGVAALQVPLDWAGAPVEALVKLGALTALSLADILLYARGAMMGLVLAGLLAAVLQNRGLQQLCNEGMQFLLGGFSRRPFLVGFMDLSPIVYFVVMNLLYGLAVGMVRALLERGPWTLGG